jgi:hypothetical protein
MHCRHFWSDHMGDQGVYIRHNLSYSRWLFRGGRWSQSTQSASPGAVFTEAKSGINNPGLNQRRQFCPDFQFVWTKWSRRRKLLSHWLLWRAGLGFQPTVSDFLHCRKLFMNSTNFQQKILVYLISIISSWSFPHCEYRLCPLFDILLNKYFPAGWPSGR